MTLARSCGISLVLVLTAAALPELAFSSETLGQLKDRLPTARPDQRPGICVEIARRQLKTADQLYGEGKVEEARAAVQDVVSYSQQAADEATRSGKKLKNTEIAVRKMAERLRDMKRTLNFEDQPTVEAAAQHLEKLRNLLLAKMFGNKE